MFEIYAYGNPFESKTEEQKQEQKRIDPHGETTAVVLVVGMGLCFLIGMITLFSSLSQVHNQPYYQHHNHYHKHHHNY